MIKIEKYRTDGSYGRIVKCPKYVRNSRGKFTHIPRVVGVHRALGRTHLSIKYHCGNGAAGIDKFEFTDDLTADDKLCPGCIYNYKKRN